MRILLADLLVCNDAFDVALKLLCPDAETFRWPALPDDGRYDVLLAWRLPDAMAALPESVSLVFCFGAGADNLLRDARIPVHLPIARLVDDEQAAQILDFATYVAFARLVDEAQRQADQLSGRWRGATGPRRQRAEMKITVLGLGPIGCRVAGGLAALGFAVRGWTRSMREVPGVQVHCGADCLATAVAGADLVINLLPLTHETENILSSELFAALAPGAYVVNLGRGRHLVEGDLEEALGSGHVGAAWLDVFREEPLPAAHRFWRHPKINVSPHVAGIPTIAGAARSLANCIDAHRGGRPLPHLVRSGGPPK